MSDPQLLDLDALVPKRIPMLVHNGQRHEYRPITVEAWLANLKDVRELGQFMDRDGVAPDQVAAEQMKVTIYSLMRSYPTLTEADFREMGMEKLDAIVKFTRALDNADRVEREMRNDPVANPPLPATPEPTKA